MSYESIVVLEPDASWSSEVETEAGAESRIVVLGRRPGESARAFEARARGRLAEMVEQGAPERGVLVYGPSKRGRIASRRVIEESLASVLEPMGKKIVAIGG